MERRQTAVIVMLFMLLAAVAAWLRFGLLAPPGGGISATENNHPDYYIENFVSTGTDRLGKKYRIIAERLAHYPLDDRASLEHPHIIQYLPSGVPRHIYADSGWLYNDAAEVLLFGNVRVVESRSGAATANTTTAATMLLRLKDDSG